MAAPVNILIVDDEPSIAEYLRNAVAHAYPGAVVRTTGSSVEALQLVADSRPQLISTDKSHRDGDGVELLRRLKEDPRNRCIPVVLASGYSAAVVDQLAAFRAGFAEVLVKPFSVAAFIDAINRLLGAAGDPDIALVYAGAESPVLDYKAGLDLQGRDERAALAKDVIAMANSGGGTIVCGVSEPSPGRFDPKGLLDQEIEWLDPTRLNNAIADYIDPTFHVAVRRVVEGARTFGLLSVPPAVDTLVLAAKQNDASGLYRGRIYFRSAACESREVQEAGDLRRLLASIRTPATPGAKVRPAV